MIESDWQYVRNRIAGLYPRSDWTEDSYGLLARSVRNQSRDRVISAVESARKSRTGNSPDIAAILKILAGATESTGKYPTWIETWRARQRMAGVQHDGTDKSVIRWEAWRSWSDQWAKAKDADEQRRLFAGFRADCRSMYEYRNGPVVGIGDERKPDEHEDRRSFRSWVAHYAKPENRARLSEQERAGFDAVKARGLKRAGIVLGEPSTLRAGGAA